MYGATARDYLTFLKIWWWSTPLKNHFASFMISIIQPRNSPKAEIKNEIVTPARKQMHTEQPSAVQCRASLRNSVFMVTEIGDQVSEEKKVLIRPVWTFTLYLNRFLRVRGRGRFKTLNFYQHRIYELRRLTAAKMGGFQRDTMSSWMRKAIDLETEIVNGFPWSPEYAESSLICFSCSLQFPSLSSLLRNLLIK